MKRRPGTILIIVVVIVMMVSLAAYHFTMSMESEHMAIRNEGDQIMSRQCALSGIDLVGKILEQPRSGRDRLLSIIDHPIDLWPSDSTNEVSYRVTISFPTAERIKSALDESAKLNLHVLLKWDVQNPGLAREALLRLPEMDESTADRLLDWIDSDSQPRLQGNEQRARNSVPLLVDELAFLQSEPSDTSRPTSVAGEAVRPAWIDHLTVHSAERNESFDGQARIFLNTPDLVGLHRQLTESVSSQIADYIVLLRQYGPSDVDATPQPTGFASEPESIDLSVAATFQITDLTQLMDSVVSLPPDTDSEGGETPAKRIRSPISLAANSAADDPIDELFDRLTLTKEKRLVGRINILTASPAVLAAIPGLDEPLAEQIARSRENLGGSLRHPIGLLSSMSLDWSIVKEVIPHMTVTGDVVRVNVAGAIGQVSSDAIPSDRSTYRCEVILDASEGPTKQAIFRRLSRASISPMISPMDLDNDSQSSPTFKSGPTSNFGSQ